MLLLQQSQLALPVLLEQVGTLSARPLQLATLSALPLQLATLSALSLQLATLSALWLTSQSALKLATKL